MLFYGMEIMRVEKEWIYWSLPPSHPPPVGSDLTELEERFLTLLSSEATLSRTQMAERLEMGLDTVKEYLRKLREKGYIERLGGNRRTGRWVVKK